MQELKKVLYSEIEGFREVGHQFLNGEINMMKFKHTSGGFGVYAHRDKKEMMIRLRIPSGVLKLEDMKLVYDLSKKYGLERIHLTTRQAIQLHGLSIDEICDLMKEALDHDLYTRGAGGNFPRNVAISPLSGVDPNEAFDVTPYALATGNYFLKEIYKYKLPRKLKVSFSCSDTDEAHCTVQDLGFLAVTKDGEQYFQVYLGGGLGQNPRLAIKYEPLIKPNEVLYYVEAMIQLFMTEGDYENRNKARVRYIVERLGEEATLKAYQKYVDELKAKGVLELTELIDTTIHKTAEPQPLEDKRVFAQKQSGLYSVYLQPVGGQLELDDFEKLIEFVESVEGIQVRLAMEEGMYFRNLSAEEAKQLLQLTEAMSGKTKLEQSVSCIGVPTCQVGLCNSQGTLRQILQHFKFKNYSKDVLPRVYLSGCQNSCGVHQVGAIGFTGKKKKVDGAVAECFTFSVGGKIGVGETQLGHSYGEMLSTQIPEFLYELAQAVEQSNLDFERYIIEEDSAFNELVEKYIV